MITPATVATHAHLAATVGWDRIPSSWSALGAGHLAVDAGWPGADRLAAACAFLDLPTDLIAALERTRRATESEPELARLVAVGRRLLWGVSERTTSLGPSLPPRWGEAGRLLWALVLVGGVEQTRALHASRGIGADVTRATLGDYLLWMEEYRTRHGTWGLEAIDWLTRHAQGGIFRLGRLQFEPAVSAQPVVVYRHRGGERVLLAADQTPLRPDGQCADAEGGNGEEGWVARLHQVDGVVVGHPITPAGVVGRDQVRLDAADWRREMGPGDRVLAVHIPAGEPMGEEACRAAFTAAVGFFADHGDAPVPRAFACDSWLLEPQLASLLPAASNIVRFQSWWRLHPVRRASSAQTLERVFGHGTGIDDLATVPQRSSLQRAVVGHFRDGGTLRNGGGLAFLSDHLDREG